jgi:hypothetical protein
LERPGEMELDFNEVNSRSNGAEYIMRKLMERHSQSKIWVRVIGQLVKFPEWNTLYVVFVEISSKPDAQPCVNLKDVDVGELFNSLAEDTVDSNVASKALVALLKAGATYDKTKCPTTGHHPLYVALSAGQRHTNCK